MQAHPRLQLAIIVLLSMALGFAVRGAPVIPAPGGAASARCIERISAFHTRIASLAEAYGLMAEMDAMVRESGARAMEQKLLRDELVARTVAYFEASPTDFVALRAAPESAEADLRAVQRECGIPQP